MISAGDALPVIVRSRADQDGAAGAALPCPAGVDQRTTHQRELRLLQGLGLGQLGPLAAQALEGLHQRAGAGIGQRPQGGDDALGAPRPGQWNHWLNLAVLRIRATVDNGRGSR